jgi:hypothetical protein
MDNMVELSNRNTTVTDQLHGRSNTTIPYLPRAVQKLHDMLLSAK